ncbi:MAG: hypothetical protein MUE60_06780 [Candidatus Eisenbacteria bacterium]|nr:hypothetical protein [Candidatus Eisenbacteria bacterium]
MRLRAIIVNIGLAVTSFLVVLVLAEGALRVRHGSPAPAPAPSPYRTATSLGSRLIPGADMEFLFESTHTPVRVTINQHGLRGPAPRMSPSAKRVLFLGDSVTFGYGVEEESTFVGRVREEWRRSLSDREAVNGGIEDAGIVEERILLEEIGAEIAPASVILCFYPNDSRPPVGFSQEYLLEDRVDRWLRTHPAVLARSRLASFLHFRYRGLLARLHLYNSPIPARFAWIDLWRSGTWRHDGGALDSLTSLARYDWGAAWHGDGWKLVERELRAIHQWCGSRGVSLRVCYSPVQVETEGPAGRSPPAGRLEALCRAMGLDFLDLLPAVRGNAGCYLDHCHYTALGHRIVARALVQWLDVPAGETSRAEGEA